MEYRNFVPFFLAPMIMPALFGSVAVAVSRKKKNKDKGLIGSNESVYTPPETYSLRDKYGIGNTEIATTKTNNNNTFIAIAIAIAIAITAIVIYKFR